jgi:hypothetical protein
VDWFKVLPENVTEFQLVKKFSAFYGKSVFATLFTNLCLCSLWRKPTDELNSNVIGITTVYVSGSLSAHQEFLAVHRHWYILCSLMTVCYQEQDGTAVLSCFWNWWQFSFSSKICYFKFSCQFVQNTPNKLTTYLCKYFLRDFRATYIKANIKVEIKIKRHRPQNLWGKSLVFAFEREHIFSIVGVEALIKRKISTQTGNRSFDPEIKHRLSSPWLLVLLTALFQPKC